MFGASRSATAPPAAPPFALPELRALDAYQLYATCLVVLFVLKAIIGVMRRARVRAAAAQGKAAKFAPILCTDAPAPAGSKGKAVVVGGGCARRACTPCPRCRSRLPAPRTRVSRTGCVSCAARWLRSLTTHAPRRRCAQPSWAGTSSSS